ncbi:MAG: aminoglycoside adenylyltransferase [Acidimicrobiia bacterium]|nr:aminoglycoside adenylyltransferase [Acidimicrobiia bacterium]
MESRAARQLAEIAEVVNVAETLDVAVWLRGGWAMDFFLDRASRPHGDIDWFMWSEQVDRLVAELEVRGYRFLPGPPPDQQRDLSKGGEEHNIALLAQNAQGGVVVAGGPGAGSPWPDGMLAAWTGRLGSIECPIISPEAQIEIKRMMPEWVPGMRRRSKDAEDIALIEAALDAE